MVPQSVFPSIFSATSAATLKNGSLASRLALKMTRALFAGAVVTVAASASAQAPIAFPSTITTVAGGATGNPASGAACATGSPLKATDALGDGCLATQALFTNNIYGIGVDNFGNLFINDTNNSTIHKVDPRSGIMTLVAGGANALTGCTTNTDTYGDGCYAATYGGRFNHDRGLSVDPYGNVLLAGYNDDVMHFICFAVSPLCPTANGFMYNVAGYTATTGSAGTAVSGTTPGTAGDGTAATGISTTGVNGPRGGAVDIFGNVYIADTGNNRFRVVLGPASYTPPGGSAVTNPLYGVIQLDPAYPTAHAGYIYPIFGSFTAVTTGNFCNGTSGAASLDAVGDGCPFFHASGGSSTTFGVTTDAAGDAIFGDYTDSRVRVLYMGGAAMASLITLENPGVTPVVGSMYTILGAGSHGISLTAPFYLGTATSIGGPTRLAVDFSGNIFVTDNSGNIDFIDKNTGFARKIGASGTNCAATIDTIGDDCPVSQSTFGENSTSQLPIALDNLGNLYFGDSLNLRIRKVSATSLIPMTVGTSATQNIIIHEPAGVTSATGAFTTASPDVTLGTQSCTATTANGDNTIDCTIPVTLLASAPGIRSAALAVTPTGGSGVATIFPLSGSATGSALVTDSATSSATGAVLSTAALGAFPPSSVAVDGSNNVYSVNIANSNFEVYIPGSGATQLAATAPTGVSQVAVDTDGNVYAVGSGSSSITKLTVTGAGAPPAYTAGTVSYSPATTPAKPQGIVVDGNGNIFVSDGANGAVYKITQAASTQPLVTYMSGLSNPTLLALDAAGTLYVYDAGTSAIYKYTVTGTKTTFLSSITATGLTTDAALDVYVQTTSGVTEYPVSGAATVSVYTATSNPTGIALDGAGNLYDADSTFSGILEVKRPAISFNFGTGSAGSPTFTATITDAGNQASTGQPAGSSNANITVTGGTSNGCTFSGTAPLEGAQAVGNACTLSASFVGSGAGTVTDTIGFQPTISTVGSLVLSGTLTGTAIGTTTAISGQTPASPSYSPSATEVTFTVTVAPISGTTAPSGTVAVTVTNTGTNATTTTNYPLTTSGSNGVATVALSGLVAGNYSISAAYPTSGSFSASTSSTSTFSVSQDITTATWTPGSSSTSYSSPIGTAVLNASATFGGSAIPGVFVYTANGVEVNAATYLAIGSYSLNVTFYPTDSVDYTSSTASGGTFTVTKASTSAPVGATQNLVAADGTGNFTSVQTALNTLSPTTGGSIYIKPGTYTGFVTVAAPFVSIYGLGGNPSNVIVTNEDGAFSSPYPTGVGGPAGPGNNGSQGDQGSATMVIARTSIAGYDGGATLTPYGFYGENFTIANTYDTDPNTFTTNYYSGGVCGVAATASSLQSLYNSGNECNSQALAIWITGDQAVLNNIYTTSQQDTIYAGSISGGSGYAARQYWFRGKVTGDVDYIFGDAAAVFDHTTIYTTWHGNTATGTETIEAQNKGSQTGSGSDYLSGYIMNSNIFTSQSNGMTALYFGRPYGHYSTWVMLNSLVDQVANVGYIEFSGDTNLPTSSYLEYNNHVYTDPATGSLDANGVPYLGTGGSTGSGAIVNGTTVVRETTSTNPGTVEASAGGFQTKYPTLANTTLSQIEAQQYYPIAFLSTPVLTNPYNNGVTVWNPTTAIANGANAFTTGGAVSSVTAGSSVTILMRPQVPGLGAVANGSYTIPTGTYTLTDSFGGGTTLASGTLDASGAAYYTTSGLAAGTHNLTWTYSGDSNFSGSTTSTPYAITVTGSSVATTTTLSGGAAITYGQSATVTATVASGSGTPAGGVTIIVDGTAGATQSLSGGATTFTLTGLSAGTHSITASYSGGSGYAPSTTTSPLSQGVGQATLTITGVCSNRVYDTANVCTAATVTGYQYSDSAATVFTAAPTSTTSATRVSPAGIYSATVGSYTLSTLGSTDYTVNPQNGTFTVSGGAPQSIIFATLPNFPHGASYQLTARTTSGIPVTYTVTAGNATVSGSTLTVNGAGTVTVQASSPSNQNYAAATPVSQSFTAQ